jgi:PmbA protein
MTVDLADIGRRIAEQAGDGEQVEAVVVHSRDTEIRVYENDIEKLSSAESQGVGIRVVRDHRQGFAYAGTFDDDVLAETLADARDNASFGTPDEHLGLAEPDGVAVPDLDLYRAEVAEFATDDKIDLALELERAVREGDPRISGVESCDYVDAISEAAVVTSTGISTSSRHSGCYLSAWVMANDGTETQTGFGFSVGRQPAELDVATAADDAVQRATRMLGATKPSSGRLTVVLDPWVTAQFLGVLGNPLSGEALIKGRSLFAGRVGEEIGSPRLTLVDDPTEVRAFSANATDAEGLASRRNVVFEAGVLKGFLHNAYTGRRLGIPSTASAIRAGFKGTPGAGPRAMAMVPGTASQEELISGVDDGVLVQSVSGLHSGVNPVSGDFSTGAEGLRIRNGAVAEPVREFTIASTLQRMLRDIAAVGSDLEWLPMRAAGVTLVIDDVTISGA